MTLPTLRGANVTLRPMTMVDVPHLVRWGSGAEFRWYQWGMRPGRFAEADARRAPRLSCGGRHGDHRRDAHGDRPAGPERRAGEPEQGERRGAAHECAGGEGRAGEQ